VLRWNNFQPIWGGWFPDSERILLQGRSGQDRGLFLTDRHGAVPKFISASTAGRPEVSPDGNGILVGDAQRAMGVFSMPANRFSLVLGLAPHESVIAWGADAQHVFVQTPTSSGLNIYKLDLSSGKREWWQAIAPKDQVGLRPMINEIAITPDGRWMSYAYRNQLSQLYRTDSFK
jgi:hypothetical protein